MSDRDLIDELLQAKVKSQLFGGEHAPRLGRLVILEALGSGGMGTVFSAYDPRLDRKVAVKLVRGRGDSSERVLREARVLGKLNHPNVVAIYDATETDGVISIVMELGPGESLRRWIGEKKSWREVLIVMRQVAQGLVAAHGAGIIHRDIKPDNIVIGPDRARLVDFGLASATSSTDGDELEGSGTPNYMAPEVLGGGAANEASDQWSFGVTLFEALYGVRPHSAATRRELERAASKAGDAPAPDGSDVPRWLHQVVMRALAGDPKARFPSMEALTVELGRDRQKRQRVLVSVVVLAIAVFAITRQYSTKPADVCGDGKARLAAAWPPASVDNLRHSLGDSPWAKKAADDFVGLTVAWEGSHRRVCEATRVQGGQTESLLELRMRCLDRRFERMNALGAALGGSLDPEARENGSEAIASLPRPERCESLVDASELALPDEPEKRTRIELAERDMDRAWALYVLGRYRDAREIAMTIEKSTSDLQFPPFRAALWLLLGSLEARLGRAESARVRLEAALGEAAAAHAASIELEVWMKLLKGELFGGNPAHVAEWTPFARAAAARAGTGTAEIDGIEAEARRDSGEIGQARRLLARALSSSDELRGDQRALLEMNLGSVEIESGTPDAAQAAFGRAFALAEAALGKGHPGLGLYLDKIAVADRARGRVSEALARHDSALELRRKVYGDGDRSVATTLLRRAQTRIEAGKITLAESDLERAREIRARALGSTHRRLSELDLALGDAAAARGDRDKAIGLYRHAAELDPSVDVATRLAQVGVPGRAEFPAASEWRRGALPRHGEASGDAHLSTPRTWRARRSPKRSRTTPLRLAGSRQRGCRSAVERRGARRAEPGQRRPGSPAVRSCALDVGGRTEPRTLACARRARRVLRRSPSTNRCFASPRPATGDARARCSDSANARTHREALKG